MLRAWYPSLVAGAALFVPAAALGQAVERNLPPAPSRGAGELPPAEAAEVAEDDRPIGADLRAIILLAPDEPLRGDTPPGVAVSPALADARVAAALRSFLGRPLSRRLIGEIEAAVTLAYRRAGLPFVSVATPEQEVTAGTLQLRVVEFRLGQLSVTGTRRTPAGQVSRGIRQRPGDRIDAPLLSQDLDWLGRYPFRRIQPVFSPGGAPGTTDLRLEVAETRPWRVYGGYANSGTPVTGRGRFYAGALLGLPGVAPDLLASYQFTAGSDLFVRRGELFGHAGDLRYVSHAGRLSVSPGARQSLALDVDFIESNVPVQDFVVRQRTYEAGLSYRAALSNVTALPGDVDLGVEARRQERLVSFGGVGVVAASAEIYQARLGWAAQWTGAVARGGVEVTFKANPGGLGGASRGAALADYTNGRVTDASYAYGRSRLQGYVGLGSGFGWSGDLSSQYATGPVPDTEQFGIGGQGLVRGYSLDDGAYDGGVVFRNELLGPTVALPGLGKRGQLAPFLFADAGFAGDRRSGRDVSAASFGAGARAQVGRALSTELAFACALVDGRATRGGNARLEIRVTLTP